MDHETSIKTQAAERYLLGELPPPEREAFEQHYFDCSECAESVRLGFQFSENAREVFRDESRLAFRPAQAGFRSWLAWLRPAYLVPAAACLTIALAVYQNAVEIPALRARVGRLERPMVLSSVLLAPSSRAAVPSIAVSSASPFFQLTLAVSAVRPAGRYECILRSGSGKTLWAGPVATLDPDTNVSVLIPTAAVSDGYYEAVLAGVTGQNVSELDHYRFAVRRESKGK